MATEKEVLAQIQRFDEIEEDITAALTRITSLINLLTSLRASENAEVRWSLDHQGRPLQISPDVLRWNGSPFQLKSDDEAPIEPSLSHYQAISMNGCDLIYHILSDLIEAFYVDLIYCLSDLDVQYENVLDTGLTYFEFVCTKTSSVKCPGADHTERAGQFRSLSRQMSDKISMYMDLLWSEMLPFVRKFISVVLEGLHLSWRDAMNSEISAPAGMIDNIVRSIQLEEMEEIRDLYRLSREIWRYKKDVEDVYEAMTKENIGSDTESSGYEIDLVDSDEEEREWYDDETQCA